MAAPPPSAAGEPPPPPPLQYSLLLQHLVGDKRQPRVWDPAALGGIPCSPKSEEQKMVERVMESCPFKAALACVGGAVRRLEGRGRQLWGGSGLPVASGQGRMEKRLQPPCFDFPPKSPLVSVTCCREGSLSAFLGEAQVLLAFPQHSTGCHKCP